MNKAADLIGEGSKPEPLQVLAKYIEDLQDAGLNQKKSITFKKMHEVFMIQKKWQAKINELYQTDGPSFDLLKKDLKDMRTKERGITLARLRHDALKKIFDRMNTVEQVQ